MQHQPSILKKHLKCDGVRDSRWSDAARLVYIATGVCFRRGDQHWLCMAGLLVSVIYVSPAFTGLEITKEN